MVGNEEQEGKRGGQEEGDFDGEEEVEEDYEEADDNEEPVRELPLEELLYHGYQILYKIVSNIK